MYSKTTTKKHDAACFCVLCTCGRVGTGGGRKKNDDDVVVVVVCFLGKKNSLVDVVFFRDL